MAQQNIDFGTPAANDGEPLSTAMPKVEANFTELYGLVAGLDADKQPLDADLTAIAALARARGDLIRGGASAWERLALGTSGYHLQSNGTDAGWAGFSQSGTGAATRTWLAKAREIIDARDFSVAADGSTDDTTALQNAINAAVANSLPLRLPIGQSKISSALTVDGQLVMMGYGFERSTIAPTNTTQNCINVTSLSPVYFSDFGIDATGITQSAGKGIYFDNGVAGRNLQSRLVGVRVIGTFQGIDFERAAYWVMDGCAVQDCKQAHIIVANQFNDDEGDSVIANCLVTNAEASPSSSVILILQNSSGGLKIIGSKLNGGYQGYRLNLADGVQTLGPIITGCSIEGQTNASISMGAIDPTDSFIARTVITGNEIAPFTNGIGVHVQAASTPTWCNGLSITGNTIATGLNGSGTTGKGISIDYASLVTIDGNTLFGNGGSTVGIELSANTERVALGTNAIHNFGTSVSDSSTSPLPNLRNLFLPSGGKIDFDSGDVTITHSANQLLFAGATSGYGFQNGPVFPTADDGAALGTAINRWSDLFLAEGGVINWDNGDVTITQSGNDLTIAGASLIAMSGTGGSTLLVSDSSASAAIAASSISGQESSFGFRTGSENRWLFGKSNDAEAGANAGSDLFVNAYDDDGNFLSQPFRITRSSGVVNFAVDRGLRFNNQTSAAGGGGGTLTNAPTAGNPGFWLKINIGGTNYAIPCWAG